MNRHALEIVKDKKYIYLWEELQVTGIGGSFRILWRLYRPFPKGSTKFRISLNSHHKSSGDFIVQSPTERNGKTAQKTVSPTV